MDRLGPLWIVIGLLTIVMGSLRIVIGSLGVVIELFGIDLGRYGVVLKLFEILCGPWRHNPPQNFSKIRRSKRDCRCRQGSRVAPRAFFEQQIPT